MALVFSNSVASTNWQLTQSNDPFLATGQGPDSVSATLSYEVGTTAANVAIAKQYTIATAANVDIDLRNLVDFLNVTQVFARAYGIQITVSGSSVTLSPSPTNGLQWFFGALNDSISIPAGGFFAIGSNTAGTVASGASVLRIANTGSSTATVKIALIGGV